MKEQVFYGFESYLARQKVRPSAGGQLEDCCAGVGGRRHWPDHHPGPGPRLFQPRAILTLPQPPGTSSTSTYWLLCSQAMEYTKLLNVKIVCILQSAGPLCLAQCLIMRTDLPLQVECNARTNRAAKWELHRTHIIEDRGVALQHFRTNQLQTEAVAF